jgi:rhodanese-related sulfurtransferase
MKAKRNPVRGAAAFVDIDHRAKRRQDSIQVPKPVEGSEGLFVVDATWGTIYPMQLAPGVRTVAELEVIAHLKNRLPLIDTRLAHFHEDSTIPGASLVPHTEIQDRVNELDPNVETVFFCNGPQCSATPAAVDSLLDAGFPAKSILYYRGGMRDWMTLGLPIIIPASPGAA